MKKEYKLFIDKLNNEGKENEEKQRKKLGYDFKDLVEFGLNQKTFEELQKKYTKSPWYLNDKGDFKSKKEMEKIIKSVINYKGAAKKLNSMRGGKRRTSRRRRRTSRRRRRTSRRRRRTSRRRRGTSRRRTRGMRRRTRGMRRRTRRMRRRTRGSRRRTIESRRKSLLELLRDAKDKMESP